MKYLYIAAGILAVLLILLVIWALAWRSRARCKVKLRCDEEKCRDLNRAVGTFGFQYDICQDIFYSAKDAWQREMGYGKIYDDHAISMGMVFDCEPIYFSYNQKSYLLELWKGQYGMSTGAEIGFYVSDEAGGEHPERLFYRCASDEEMLQMRFVLRKKGRILVMREERHWWLTGFVLGEFSKKEELGMEVSITFRDCQMRNAFYEALLRAGYKKENICVSGSRVRFSFTKPCYKGPKHWRLRVWWVQWKNKRNCRRYRRVTGCFVRTIDRVDYLGMCFPGLYRLLGRLSRIPRKKKCRRRRA
ncbi:MAG: DUF4474 domain-containing protein [Lachnospiraceae bacterium]|nr:DUF4474 domain-containing protein [Lachnospiraceae bacterium]